MLLVYLLSKYSQLTDEQNMWIIPEFLIMHPTSPKRIYCQQRQTIQVAPYFFLPALIVERHVYNMYHLFVYSP